MIRSVGHVVLFGYPRFWLISTKVKLLESERHTPKVGADTCNLLIEDCSKSNTEFLRFGVSTQPFQGLKCGLRVLHEDEPGQQKLHAIL
jgi:hypothetical protein